MSYEKDVYEDMMILEKIIHVDDLICERYFSHMGSGW